MAEASPSGSFSYLINFITCFCNGPPRLSFLMPHFAIQPIMKGSVMQSHVPSQKTQSKLDAVLQLLKDFAVPTVIFFALQAWTPFVEASAKLVPPSPMSALWYLLLWCLLCDAWFILMRFGIALLGACGNVVIAFIEATGAAVDGSMGGVIGISIKALKPFIIGLIAVAAVGWVLMGVESACPNEFKPMLEIAIALGFLACIVGPSAKTLARDIAALTSALR